MGKRIEHLVPDDVMIPVGAKWTEHTRQCADSWTDSTLQAMRSELPIAYHAVPTDWLGRRWRDIRKKDTPGYKLNGKGPAKGSRKKAKKPEPQDQLFEKG